MVKTKTAYRCTECGAEYSKWQGRCDTCGEWNTLVEEIVAPKVAAGGGASRRIGGTRSLAEGGSIAATPRLREVVGSNAKRWKTSLDEFDFVLGGGIVPGSMVLIGGEPGIGKSTLLLQVATRLEAGGHATLYASGEESPLQRCSRPISKARPATSAKFASAPLGSCVTRRKAARPCSSSVT